MKQETDGRKINVFLYLGWSYLRVGTFDKAGAVFKKILKIKGKHSYEYVRSEAYRSIGMCEYYNSNYENAIKNYEDSLLISRRIGSLLSEADALNNLGNVYRYQGDVTKALEYFNASLKINRSIKDPCLEGNVLNNIGIIYRDINEYDSSIKFYKKSLKVRQQNKFNNGTADCYSNIGEILFKKKDFIKALEYFNKGYEIRKEVNNKSTQIISLVNIGCAYTELNNFENAIEFLNKAVKLCHECNNPEFEACSYLSIARVYKKTKNYLEAEKFLLKALSISKRIKSRIYFKDINDLLLETYESQGKFGKAYSHFKKYHEDYTRYINTESETRLKNMKVIFEKEQAENESEIHRLRSLELKRELDTKNRELNMMASYLLQKNEFVKNVMINVSGFVKNMNIDKSGKHDLGGFLKKIETGSRLNDDIISFEKNLNSANLGFISKISKKYPTLSPVELKICSLIKINLSSKEIAKLLYISNRTVQNHRHRIIFKLRLPKGRSLTEFINSI
ncbi:MAG: LuxR family transcriptional regulator [Ignavibacteria bacterium]|nr:LuxR family transcriptional regulator [Ignavibacteria bacterium]